MLTTVHGGNAVVQHADDAAEAVRLLNHLTRDHDVLDDPAEAYAVVGSLELLVQRLPQLLRQLSHLIDSSHAAGQLAADTGQPAQLAAVTRAQLADAATRLGPVLTALGAAHEALAGASYTGPTSAPDLTS